LILLGSSFRESDDYELLEVPYIHYNPVKHGYVVNATDWPYSSIHQWVKLGVYPSDWTAVPATIEQD